MHNSVNLQRNSRYFPIVFCVDSLSKQTRELSVALPHPTWRAKTRTSGKEERAPGRCTSFTPNQWSLHQLLPYLSTTIKASRKRHVFLCKRASSSFEKGAACIKFRISWPQWEFALKQCSSKCKMRCKFHSYATEWVKTEVSITSAHFLEPHSKNICVGFVEGECSEGMFWKQLRRPCGLGLMETAQPTREDLSPTPQPHVALGTLWASWWKHPLWSRRESADGPSFRLRNPHDRVYTEVQAPSSI